MAKVYVKFNSAVIKEVPLTKEATTFGRKPDNDIVIDNPAISGFHGKIVKEGDQFFVEDLNSTNGTFVNGQKVKRHSLKAKDQISIARHVLEFVSDDAAPTPMSAPISAAPSSAGTPPAPPVAPPPPMADAPSPVPTTEAEKRAAQIDILKKSLGMEAPAKPTNGGGVPSPIAPAAAPSQGAVVKIIMGGVDGQAEVRLKDLVTYIGSSDQALIKIKGIMAPSLAAAISKRPEGYFLKAVKPGYPKVNGHSVNEQTLLENGALIEVGGTNMIFYFSDSKKDSKDAAN